MTKVKHEFRNFMRNSHIPHSTVVDKPIDYFLENIELIFRNRIALKYTPGFLSGNGRNQPQRMNFLVVCHNMSQFRRNRIGVGVIRPIGNHTIRDFCVSVCGKCQTPSDDVRISACDECNTHRRGHILGSHSDFFIQIFIGGFIECIGTLFLLLNGIGNRLFGRSRIGNLSRIVGFL